MACGDNSRQAESISDRLQRATEDLKILEQLILCGDFSPRLLGEFRNAVDSIRSTARIVQMWVGLQQQHRDPYSAMNTMAADRVRRAVQIAQDLTVDLQAMEVDLDTDGMADLYRAVNELQERLAPLFHQQDEACGADRPLHKLSGNDGGGNSPQAKP